MENSIKTIVLNYNFLNDELFLWANLANKISLILDAGKICERRFICRHQHFYKIINIKYKMPITKIKITWTTAKFSYKWNRNLDMLRSWISNFATSEFQKRA